MVKCTKWLNTIYGHCTILSRCTSLKITLIWLMKSHLFKISTLNILYGSEMIKITLEENNERRSLNKLYMVKVPTQTTTENSRFAWLMFLTPVLQIIQFHTRSLNEKICAPYQRFPLWKFRNTQCRSQPSDPFFHFSDEQSLH